jgi:predicted nucleotidyltransferase
MQKERLLRRAGTKFSVVENVRTAALRLLLNLSDLDFSVLKKSGFVKRAGIYGSFAKGTNNEHSDIDLWLLVEGASETELAGLTKVLKAMDGRIRPLYLTREKLERLKRDEKTFYHSLVFGSIDIYGDANEPI